MILKNSHSILQVAIMTIIVLGCTSDESEPEYVVPSDLKTVVTARTDGSGIVEVESSAVSTFRFGLLPGDGSDEVLSSEGSFIYQYGESGTYDLEVRAYGNSPEFISEVSKVVVEKTQEGGGISDEGYSTPLDYDDLTRIWNDEFDGNSLNEEDWNFEIGTGDNGWGNNELQYYRKENTEVEDGYLRIITKKESFGSRSYTSSRLTTQDKFDFKYGRVDIRALLPKGQGIWPALWMLGSNFSSVGWPKCGEMDIMEMVGGGAGKDDTVYGTIHWDNNGSYACTCDQDTDYRLSSGIFADEFHVFSIVWDATSIKWYVDDQLYKTVDTSPSDLSEFQNNFFFIFNVAVGGNWPGSPNSSTVFPQQMVVDYVRVYQ